MMNYLLVTLLFFPVSLCFSQIVPVIEWEKNYGGSGEDYSFGIDKIPSGGYVVAGSTRSTDHDITGVPDLFDFWIIKINDSGDLIWNKNYGGSHEEEAYAIRSNPDGSSIVVGYSDSDDGNVTGHHGTVSYTDFWVVKLNSIGNIHWAKSYGGSADEKARDVRRTSDGGFIVVGWTNSTDGDVQNVTRAGTNYWVLKLNAIGTIEWQKTFGGSGSDAAHSVEQTSDNGFVIAGASNSIDGDISSPADQNSSNYWIVKIDSLGNLEWEKSIGTSSPDMATSIAGNSSGGITVAGTSGGNYRLVNMSLDGTVQANYTIGGSSIDNATSIRMTSDNGHILAGQSQSSDGDVSGGVQFSADYWITKMNADTITWQTRLGTPEWDYGAHAIEGHNGSYLITGYKHGSGGDASNHYGNNDFWVVKLREAHLGSSEKDLNEMSIYPNPFIHEISMKNQESVAVVRIYDLLGNLVLETSQTKNINLEASPGSYILRSFGQNGTQLSSTLIIKQ